MAVQQETTVSVIGLGKLGSPIAAGVASRGYKVIGVDLNEKVVANFAAGKTTLNEPGLAELMASSKDYLDATTDTVQAVRDSDISLIIVPTPSTPEGGFSSDYVLSTLESIGKALREKSTYHLVVLCSTVLPGTSDAELIPALEKFSQKKCGVDFGYCYSPEFVALGSVVNDFLHPSFLLIGGSDERAGKTLHDFYMTLHAPAPPVAQMNVVNAELAKISVNTFVTTKITYANMLARICERLPGADANVVTDAVGLDPRIGRKYLRGGVSYGGPCFPRDNIAFSYMAKQIGAPAGLAEITHAMNRANIKAIADIVHDNLPGAHVGILGLAYKAHTDVIEESPSIALINDLLAAGHKVTCYDPIAVEPSRKEAPDAVFVDSAAECIRACDALVIMTPYDNFIDSLFAASKEDMPKCVVDCWRMVDSDKLPNDVRYIALGKTISPQ